MRVLIGSILRRMCFAVPGNQSPVEDICVDGVRAQSIPGQMEDERLYCLEGALNYT